MSDSNTPPDETSSSGQNPQPGAWLPPRLREKLDAPDDTPDDWSPKSSSPVPAILTTALVLIVFAGGFIWWRSASQKKSGHATASAQADATSNTGGTAPAASATDSLATADSTTASSADTLASTRSTASTTPAEASKPAATTTRPTASTPPSPGSASGTSSATASRATASTTSASKPKPKGEPSGSGAAAAAPPSAGSGFGLVVGSYLFEDRANSELSRLEGVTGLSGTVTTSTEGGNTNYDVVLGRFGSRAAAEKKATALVDSNQVRQAQVISRSK